MTLVFVLVVVTVMLMMLQKLAARIPPDAEAPSPAGADGSLYLARLRLIIQLLATIVGLAGGGYIVLYGNYSIEVQYWAAGLVGSIFGFWLK